MKIMISQPMRGKTNEQIRQEREELVEKLKQQGHKVLNSIFSGEMPIECDMPIFLLAKSIEVLSKTDAVVFMKGWEKARGCKIEHEVAVQYGKKVYYDNSEE